MLHIASLDSFFCIFATNKRQLYLQVPFHLTDAPSSFFIFLTANWEPNENLSIEILVAVPRPSISLLTPWLLEALKKGVLNLKSLSKSESGVHRRTQEFYKNGLRIRKPIHVHRGNCVKCNRQKKRKAVIPTHSIPK